MSIYLAWSVYKLIIALVLIVLVSVVLLYTGSKQDSIKSYKKVTFSFSGFALLCVLLMAFNIGDRQQDIGRSDFNAAAPETVDKIESQRQNIESVQQTFQQAVKKTN